MEEICYAYVNILISGTFWGLNKYFYLLLIACFLACQAQRLRIPPQN